MNAAGQTLLEFTFLIVLFLLFIGVLAPKIPLTFSQATPYLGGKIQARLETGNGFASWDKPLKPKGGVRD